MAQSRLSSLPLRLIVLAVVLGMGTPPKFALGQVPADSTAPHQAVRGQVVVQSTGQPLPGAHVVIQNTTPVRGTTTDSTGHFVLSRVPLGRHDIRITFVGYTPVVRSNVLVTAGKENVLHVELAERVVSETGVIVTPELSPDEPINPMALVSARSFTVEETRRYAGGFDDPARMASAFAGITPAAGTQTNAISVRGNAPKGVQWRLEGVPIPNPNHFAGLAVAGAGGLTLFSSHVLSDSDILTGAFPAEYGNALAGVFDMHFRRGNSNRREHTAQVGLLGIDVASEGPFQEGREATYLFNYRYSTLGILLPLLPTDASASFQDLSFNVHLPTEHWGQFEVWGLGGLDAQTMVPVSDSSDWTYENDRTKGSLNLGVGAAGLRHHLTFEHSQLTSTLAATGRRTRWSQQRLDDDLRPQPNQYILDRTGRLRLDLDWTRKVRAGHLVEMGMSGTRLLYELDLRTATSDTPPLRPVAQGHGASTLLQGYMQSLLHLRPSLSLNAGIHGLYAGVTGHGSVEPRASLHWAVADRHTVRVAYGRHSQMEDLRIYFVQSANERPNRSLDLTRAHHGTLGYSYEVTPSVQVEVEGYVQSLSDVPVIADSSFSMLNFEQDWAFDAPLVNDGAGLNYGLDLTLQRPLDDGYYAMLTGSLFRSRYRGGDGIWRPTRFDRQFTLNALGGAEWTVGQNNLLGVNARIAWLGGKRRSL